MGLPLAALTSVVAGLLDGDPVLRAVRVVGTAGHRRAALRAGAPCCRRCSLMVVGWFVVMNVLQPRIMREPSASTRSSSSGRCSSARGWPASPAPSSGSRSRRSSRPSSSTSSSGRPATGPSPDRAAKRVGPSARAGPVRVTARAGAGHRGGRGGPTGRRTAAPNPVRRPSAEHVSDDPPDMTRGTGTDASGATSTRNAASRWRGRRGAGRPARAPRAAPGRWPSGRAGRGSSSPTTTASNRAGCSRSSRRSTRSAT